MTIKKLMNKNISTSLGMIIIAIAVVLLFGGVSVYSSVSLNSISLAYSISQVSSGSTDITGKYSGFYGFPSSFFSQSVVTKQQMVKVTDAQTLGLRNMHNGISPYNFCRIEYNSSVYGSTTPYGIQLGDSAFPGLNSGNPRWAVIGHEQGHNFFGGTSAFYSTMAIPGPFLQESLAVLSSFYTYHYALNSSVLFGLTANALKSFNTDMSAERTYQKNMYNQYVQGGKKFNENDVLTSQALDYKMITYGEQYGWFNFKKVSKTFADPMASKFTFQNDGVSDTERSTYIIAALSASFNRDFRSDFRSLNFLIDDTLYTQIYTTLKANI